MVVVGVGCATHFSLLSRRAPCGAFKGLAERVGGGKLSQGCVPVSCAPFQTGELRDDVGAFGDLFSIVGGVCVDPSSPSQFSRKKKEGNKVTKVIWITCSAHRGACFPVLFPGLSQLLPTTCQMQPV